MNLAMLFFLFSGLGLLANATPIPELHSTEFKSPYERFENSLTDEEVLG